MAFRAPRGRNGPFLNKNQSIKPFKNKKRKRDTLSNQREILLIQYGQVDSSKLDCFEKFPLSLATKRGLQSCNYRTPTEIQIETIILALKKHDVLGAAKTGSGKTLAFVIPIFERLFCEGWSTIDGLGALVITPTRELAFQIFEVCRDVGSFHDFTMGLVIGGKDLQDERRILDGYNIVICTPGRLLQHMDENPLFSAMNLQMLILDEADRILDMGFMKDMNAIIENLPIQRQTLLFSATQTRSVKDLARLSLKNPMYVSVHEFSKHVTPESLEQSFIVCELSKKMDFIWSFIKNHKRQKIIIFMATCKQVKFTFEIFCRIKPGMSLMALYGGLHQLKRMERYKSFCQKNHAVLFATDIAARGLDFPNVNWVVQLDCPEDTNTYIHRAGRTARIYQGGESLLVLLPSEKDSMVKQLEDRKIPINEIKVHPSKIASMQKKMQILCARDVNMKESAQRAFKSYYKSMSMMKDKTVFNIQHLFEKEIQEAYSKSLGLAFAPRVRYVEKKTKPQINNEKEEQQPSCSKEQKTLPDLMASDNSDDEAFLKPVKKQRSPSISDDEETAREIAELMMPKKVITKATVVKRILKKKIKSTSIKFNNDGKIIEDMPKQLKAELANEIAQDMAQHGYDVEKAKELMKAEDAIDKGLHRQRVKEKHKEEKQKLRAERMMKQPKTHLRIQIADDDGNNENSFDGGIDDRDESVSDNNEEPKQLYSASDNDECSTNEDNDECSANEDNDKCSINEDNSSLSEDEEEEEKKEEEMPTKKRKIIASTVHSKKLLSSKKANLEEEEMLALHFLENT